jgi:interferon-induced GTP-binding protein Mx1
MQEQCYVFVHDKDKLAKFFEEDADLVARRLEATNKRDRLAKANAAMANIQVERGGLGLGPTRVRVTVALGQAGLGLQLADEGGRLVVRGFRAMEGPNPGMEAGIKAGDVIDQVSDGGGGGGGDAYSPPLVLPPSFGCVFDFLLFPRLASCSFHSCIYCFNWALA